MKYIKMAVTDRVNSQIFTGQGTVCKCAIITGTEKENADAVTDAPKKGHDYSIDFNITDFMDQPWMKKKPS
jgi:hypothetical protein